MCVCVCVCARACVFMHVKEIKMETETQRHRDQRGERQREGAGPGTVAQTHPRSPERSVSVNSSELTRRRQTLLVTSLSAVFPQSVVMGRADDQKVKPVFVPLLPLQGRVLTPPQPTTPRLLK